MTGITSGVPIKAGLNSVAAGEDLPSTSPDCGSAESAYAQEVTMTLDQAQVTISADTPILAGTDTSTMPATLVAALQSLQEGRPILVADDQGRENEVDAIMAAQFATPESVAWLVRHTSGYLCAPMQSQRADFLDLPTMVINSEDSRRTAYTVSCDSAHGITTGISSADRAATLQVLANDQAQPTDLIRPGHILPLRAVPGGVLSRPGHTEAGVDLTRLAGLMPVAVIAEMVKDDGSMLRLGDIPDFAPAHGLVVISIAELVDWRRGYDFTERAAQSRVTELAQAHLPTEFGDFMVHAYRDSLTGAEHLALFPRQVSNPREVPLVRVHSECLTGEAFTSLRCDCGPQLHQAMDKISQDGGALIYLRGQEGRGIGLAEKIKAYHLQEEGFDTLNANTQLGWPVDGREYGAAAAILQAHGLTKIRLATNSPDKIHALSPQIEIVEVVPIQTPVTAFNRDYLLAKKVQLGHHLTQLQNK